MGRVEEGCGAEEALQVTPGSVGGEEGCTDQESKGSGLEANMTHNQSKDYSRDTRGSHRGVVDKDMGSCREVGRGTGIVQDKGLEIVAVVLWCVGKMHTREWGSARHSGAWDLGKQSGELGMVRQSGESEMVRVEGLRNREEVAALGG